MGRTEVRESGCSSSSSSSSSLEEGMATMLVMGGGGTEKGGTRMGRKAIGADSFPQNWQAGVGRTTECVMRV
jgi:hypothetical protein